MCSRLSHKVLVAVLVTGTIWKHLSKSLEGGSEFRAIVSHG